MSEIKYRKFQDRLYYLQMNIKATRKNVTNDFRINFRYVFVYEKQPCQWNARKCRIKDDFNQNGSLSIS